MKKLRINIAPMYPIITIAALLQFCAPKASNTVATASYEEDLSIYRKEYAVKDDNSNTKPVKQEEEFVKPDIEPTNHIREELDSIRQIIIAQSKDTRYVEGWTIQLYSGNNRDKANEYKRRAYELVEGVRPRVSYEQPNYKVRMGQYFDRLEANADYTLVKSNFGRAVLVPFKINIEDYLETLDN
ncbi:SPOR domain-containing protein [Reichenbachiella versicolor]|uniref:SPOR domain-containing protein n=1 Tax=Reichenbachiella versicolor TaxID=1821036 RepID=UPI0013A57D98|nr:SPOR domain-containing protein [Reichenbachiella versicolor]